MRFVATTEEQQLQAMNDADSGDAPNSLASACSHAAGNHAHDLVRLQLSEGSIHHQPHHAQRRCKGHWETSNDLLLCVTSKASRSIWRMVHPSCDFFAFLIRLLVQPTPAMLHQQNHGRHQPQHHGSPYGLGPLQLCDECVAPRKATAR